MANSSRSQPKASTLKAKSRPMRKVRKGAYVLADLIRAVRVASNNDGEAVAAVADLLNRDVAQFITQGRKVRVRVCQQ